jgi:hypothetical protein
LALITPIHQLVHMNYCTTTLYLEANWKRLFAGRVHVANKVKDTVGVTAFVVVP